PEMLDLEFQSRHAGKSNRRANGKLATKRHKIHKGFFEYLVPFCGYSSQKEVEIRSRALENHSKSRLAVTTVTKEALDGELQFPTQRPCSNGRIVGSGSAASLSAAQLARNPQCEIWLRARSMRSMYDPGRRKSHAVLRDSREPGRRPRHHHARRARHA